MADSWCGIMPLAKATSASLWSASALVEELAEELPSLIIEPCPAASEESSAQPASSRVPATRAPMRRAMVRVMSCFS